MRTNIDLFSVDGRTYIGAKGLKSLRCACIVGLLLSY